MDIDAAEKGTAPTAGGAAAETSPTKSLAAVEARTRTRNIITRNDALTNHAPSVLEMTRARETPEALVKSAQQAGDRYYRLMAYFYALPASSCCVERVFSQDANQIPLRHQSRTKNSTL